MTSWELHGDSLTGLAKTLADAGLAILDCGFDGVCVVGSISWRTFRPDWLCGAVAPKRVVA